MAQQCSTMSDVTTRVYEFAFCFWQKEESDADRDYFQEVGTYFLLTYRLSEVLWGHTRVAGGGASRAAQC